MMWVKLTLPPLERLRKLLITVRWSITIFIGTERTVVAVGIDSEASMFFAVRIGAPFMMVRFASDVLAAGRFAGFGASAESLLELPGESGVSERRVSGASTAGVDFLVGSAGACWAAGTLPGAA